MYILHFRLCCWFKYFIRQCSESFESSIINLKVIGPKEINASDIDCGAHVEVLNEDLHICTLDISFFMVADNDKYT